MTQVKFICFECGLMGDETFGHHIRAYGGDDCPYDAVECIVAPIAEAEEWYAYHDPRSGGDLHTRTWLSATKDYFGLENPRPVLVIPALEASI